MNVLAYCAAYGLYRPSLESILGLEGWTDFMWGMDNPYDVGKFNRMHNYTKARKIALENGYDALFLVESDMIVPSDAIAKLLYTGAPIAYGLYCWRHIVYGNSEWNLYQGLRDGRGNEPAKVPYPSWSTEIGPRMAAWGKVVPVTGMGFGGTLIRREALKRLEMRRGGPCDCDWFLACDAVEQGITQLGHAGVVCGHIHHEQPIIIWPDARSVYRVEPIKEPEQVFRPYLEDRAAGAKRRAFFDREWDYATIS